MGMSARLYPGRRIDGPRQNGGAGPSATGHKQDCENFFVFSYPFPFCWIDDLFLLSEVQVSTYTAPSTTTMTTGTALETRSHFPAPHLPSGPAFRCRCDDDRSCVSCGSFPTPRQAPGRLGSLLQPYSQAPQAAKLGLGCRGADVGAAVAGGFVSAVAATVVNVITHVAFHVDLAFRGEFFECHR
jgi:hypothetical protein